MWLQLNEVPVATELTEPVQATQDLDETYPLGLDDTFADDVHVPSNLQLHSIVQLAPLLPV